MKIGSNVTYSGTLSTASNFILEELTNNPNSLIECLPTDDAISLMKMILLEILPKSFQESISSKVRQSSFSGILAVYDEIKEIWTNKPSVLIEIINFLEKNRRTFNDKQLNSFIDRCLENHQSLFKLENQPTDMNFFNNLTKQIFSS